MYIRFRYSPHGPRPEIVLRMFAYGCGRSESVRYYCYEALVKLSVGTLVVSTLLKFYRSRYISASVEANMHQTYPLEDRAELP